MKKKKIQTCDFRFSCTHHTDDLLFLHPSNHHRGGRKRQEESWWLCRSSGLGSRRFRLPGRLSVRCMGSHRRCEERENVNISQLPDVCTEGFNFALPCPCICFKCRSFAREMVLFMHCSFSWNYVACFFEFIHKWQKFTTLSSSFSDLIVRFPD